LFLRKRGEDSLQLPLHLLSAHLAGHLPVFSLPINPTSLPVPLPEGVGIPELEPELGPLKLAANKQ